VSIPDELRTQAKERNWRIQKEVREVFRGSSEAVIEKEMRLALGGLPSLSPPGRRTPPPQYPTNFKEEDQW